MINSDLELLNCTVFGDLNGSENIFCHSSSSNLYFLFQEIFPVGMSVDFLVDCTCPVLLFCFLDIFGLKVV